MKKLMKMAIGAASIASLAGCGEQTATNEAAQAAQNMQADDAMAAANDLSQAPGAATPSPTPTPAASPRPEARPKAAQPKAEQPKAAEKAPAAPGPHAGHDMANMSNSM